MKYLSIVLTLFLLLVSTGCGGVDPNVPDAKDFDRILTHDLTEYVTDPKDKDITVTYELLRDRPSQSGVALPKFYVWVEKHAADGKLMEDAAARIAAVDGTHFDVIQYFNREQITKDPDIIKGMFPDEAVKKIYAKLGIDGK